MTTSITTAPKPGVTTGTTKPIHPRWVADPKDGGGILYLSELTDERIEVVKLRRGRWDVVHVGECPTCFGRCTDGDPCGDHEFCDGGNGETRDNTCECDRCMVLAAQYCPEQL